MKLRVGIDLDNTLICYDRVFERLARERGIAAASGNKKNIRDAVRAAAGNDVWTELQGLAYGPGMEDAAWMPGAEDFLEWTGGEDAEVCVISHKTRRSAIGNHDLHAPALSRLRALGFEPGRDAFLEETREAKFGRIGSLGLTHFVDDLEEFLTDPAFPAGVERVHFAPDGKSAVQGFKSFETWSQILEYFKKIKS